MFKCISLEWFECAMASEIGRMRMLGAIKNKRKDNHGFEGLGWSEHIEGACGELAVAKAIGVYWNGSIGSFKGADIQGGIQVRTRLKHNYELIVRHDDKDSHVFVLVTGRCPEYRVHGWMLGRDAKQQRWLQEHGDRPAAFFVPQGELQSIDSIQGSAPNDEPAPLSPSSVTPTWERRR